MNTPVEPKPDLQSVITPALVDRVSERLAMGIPLRIAIAGEPVTRTEYKDYLREHPELAALELVAKRRFLENAFSVMLEGEQAPANFRWLIELAYQGIVGNDEDQLTKQKQTILGLPEEIIEQMRQNARSL